MMSDKKTASAAELRGKIAEQYGQIARDVLDQTGRSGCCGPSCGAVAEFEPITGNLYSNTEMGEVPDAAAAASLGCGNPTALAELHEGETVLDLGSGGGIDVLLSARRVGPTGKAYGLDMTDDMLDLARRNQAEAGVDNVEFLKGTIENIPLPDQTIDVIISNCVINLSSDKEAVLREAYRVLTPGGRFAVSDIVVRGELDPKIRASIESWIGCVAGALSEDDYKQLLASAGFVDVEIEPTRVFDIADVSEMLHVDAEPIATATGEVASAFIRARRPR
jgi:SAM-dependent methyltransferase